MERGLKKNTVFLRHISLARVVNYRTVAVKFCSVCLTRVCSSSTTRNAIIFPLGRKLYVYKSPDAVKSKPVAPDKYFDRQIPRKRDRASLAGMQSNVIHLFQNSHLLGWRRRAPHSCVSLGELPCQCPFGEVHAERAQIHKFLLNTHTRSPHKSSPIFVSVCVCARILELGGVADLAVPGSPSPRTSNPRTLGVRACVIFPIFSALFYLAGSIFELFIYLCD